MKELSWFSLCWDLGFACLAFKCFPATSNSLNCFGCVHLIPHWSQSSFYERWILTALGIQMCRARVRNLGSELRPLSLRGLTEFFLQQSGWSAYFLIVLPEIQDPKGLSNARQSSSLKLKTHLCPSPYGFLVRDSGCVLWRLCWVSQEKLSLKLTSDPLGKPGSLIC